MPHATAASNIRQSVSKSPSPLTRTLPFAAIFDNNNALPAGIAVAKASGLARKSTTEVNSE
jgi:hypothetical protein